MPAALDRSSHLYTQVSSGRSVSITALGWTIASNFPSPPDAEVRFPRDALHVRLRPPAAVCSSEQTARIR
jgi:hypothetical protein